jgi:Holliday junction resolvasome RuvABC endonuclease subunit
MTTIAFTFSTNDFEYVALTGTKANPTLHSKGKILLPANHDIPQTVAWFEAELELLLNNIQPDSVSYRLTVMKVTNNYVSSVYYGQGILNLLCHKKNIQISHTSPASITANKFNQPKGTNLSAYIEGLLGKQSSPWDKGIKDTALIALINL